MEFAKLNEGRLARRLRDRWKCKVGEHSYCFKTAESIHLQLTEGNIDEWANTIHDGLGTVLVPPAGILQLNTRSNGSDANSHYSRSSLFGYVLPYQRPFNFQLNPSLTDIRSWHKTLASSSVSSGIPGPGYLSGKMIKWVGEKILDAATPLEIKRRLWTTRRLFKHMEKQPVEERWKWLLRNGKVFYRTLDDVLELSSDEYQAKYQAAAFEHSKTIKLCWRLARPGTAVQNSIIEMKITLLRILYGGDTSPNCFGANLREILLQEAVDISSTDSLVAELLACAFDEVHYSLSPKSRADAFLFLRRLYLVPSGRRQLERLGPLLENLARKVYHADIADHLEYATAVRLFVSYAHDHPKIRKEILAPKGLGLVPRLKLLRLPGDSEPISALCWTLDNVTDLEWVLPSLLDIDTCETLFDLLISLHRSNLMLNESAYDVVATLHKFATEGGELGRRIVYDAMIGETREALLDLKKADWGASWMTSRAHSRIHDILGDDG